jgi:hypothetical protein
MLATQERLEFLTPLIQEQGALALHCRIAKSTRSKSTSSREGLRRDSLQPTLPLPVKRSFHNMTSFVRRARDALRPFEQEEQTPSVKPQADNTSTKTQQYGSRNSFETPTQRAATVPVAGKPVFPLIPGRSLPLSAIPVISGTGQEARRQPQGRP